MNPTFELVHYPAMSVIGGYGNCRLGALKRADTSPSRHGADDQSALPTGLRDFHPEKTATGLPSRETLEISEFLRSLLRSDAQTGPTRRCPPDGYDIVDPRFAMR